MDDFMAYISAMHGRPIRKKAFDQQMRAQLAANKTFIENAAVAHSSIKQFNIDSFGRSLCFVAPHWGNYAASFVQCAFALPDGDQFLAFRGNQWGSDEDAFWQRVNGLSRRHVDVYHTDKDRNVLPLLRRMREGAHLFALYDLFGEFGNTEQLKLFDNELAVAFGWARLCYLSDAVVVSIAPVSEHRGQVEVLDVLDPRQFPDSTAFLDRCRRTCGRSLELLLAEQPAFWFMWEHLEKYVVKGAQ